MKVAEWPTFLGKTACSAKRVIILLCFVDFVIVVLKSSSMPLLSFNRQNMNNSRCELANGMVGAITNTLTYRV